MWLFYICAIIPVAIGAILWWRDEEVTWQEWLGGAAAAFLLAAMLHALALIGMTGDTETWSGQITATTHYGQWVEEYEEMHTREVPSGTDKDGNTTYTTEIYYTTEHATHYENWDVDRDFGADTDDRDVERSTHEMVKAKFGGGIDRTYEQSTTHGGHYDGGDRNAYVTINKTGYVFPVTKTKSFENKVKAAPTVFSFIKVPTNIAVYPWPNNPDWMNSDRLVGTARLLVNPYKWDCMNASLGPRKRVNVIMVGFADVPSDMGQYQEAKWIGGKKNDLVICYGGATRTSPPKWVYVFGWTESELVKNNLQTLLLSRPINDEVIPLISEEIIKNYTIKDWHKFDYITIDPPTWSYWVYFIAMILTQGGLYIYFHSNEFSKEGSGYGYNRFRRRW